MRENPVLSSLIAVCGYLLLAASVVFVLWESGRAMDPSAPADARVFHFSMVLIPASWIVLAVVLLGIAGIISRLARVERILSASVPSRPAITESEQSASIPA